MERVRLEMNFLDEENKKFKISIEEPKEELDGAQIKDAMEGILEHDIFLSNGVGLIGLDGARFVRTSIEDIEL